MSSPAPRYYLFGPFRVDVVRRLLTRNGGDAVALTSKAFDTLLELVRADGEVLAKETLLDRIWPDTVVEEKNLTVAISALRKALGETPQEHLYIVTVPGRGYRFVADVFGEKEAELDGVGADAGGAPSSPEPAVRDGRRRVAPVAVALAVGVLVAAGCVGYWVLFRPASAGTRIDTLAVLPFKPINADGRDESLELGMADTLITRLSHLRLVTVRPVSAVRRYAAVDQDAVAAGRELQVAAVLEGSVQRVGDRVRVNVRLLRVRDGVSLWASNLDERFTDIFALQDAIAERVAGALAIELSGDERQQLTKRYTENAEAYEYYLKGRYFWAKRTEEAVLKSVEYFERAVAVDPAYAPAYAGLADAYHSMVYWDEYAPRELMPKAKRAAERALALDEALAEAHTSLAIVLEDYEWDFAAAEREYQRAIALNPNYAFARQRYGQFLMEMGRFDESRVEHARALDVDPVSLNTHLSLAALLYFRRDYDAAVAELRRTIEIDPSYPNPYGLLGVVYREKGMYREAVDAWLHDSGPERAAVLRSAFERGGIEGFLRKDAELTRQQLGVRRQPPIFLAMEYAYLGEKDDAFAILDAAYAERHSWLGELRFEPAWDNLRSDARFADLLRRVGLAS